MTNFRIIGFLVCFLSLGVVNGFSQMTPDEALSKFVSAGIAYKDGRYEQAIEAYSEILQGGRESGAVYYNLGNSYFRVGDVGRAMLNYERAKRLIPRDSDLNFNENYVRLRKGNNDAQNVNFVTRAVENHIQFYTVDEMVLIITCVMFGIGIVFLLSLYMQWPLSWSRGIIILLAVILVAYGAGLVIKVQSEKDLAVALVDGESYFEPMADSTLHFKLSEGAKVKILKSEGRWKKVRRFDGKVGWVSQDVLEKIQ